MSENPRSKTRSLCACGRPSHDTVLPLRSKFRFGNLNTLGNAGNRICMYDVAIALNRHGQEDWGDVPENIQKLNADSLNSGQGSLLSHYESSHGVGFYIMTVIDPCETNLFLDEEARSVREFLIDVFGFSP